MSVEITLREMSYGVSPLEENGKQITLVNPLTRDGYLIPFDEKAVENLVRLLGSTNEELQAEIEEQQRLARVAAVKEGIAPPPGTDPEGPPAQD